MTEFLDRAELEAEHLEELIGQLLMLAKIDAVQIWIARSGSIWGLWFRSGSGRRL